MTARHRSAARRGSPGGGFSGLPYGSGYPEATPKPPADQAALIQEINAEHAEAVKHADLAIEHARRAGALLLEVKATLDHGAFLPWIDENVNVSRRQAQRYMRAAQGKPTTARAIKNDTVSHFADGANWLPASDHEMLSLSLEPFQGSVMDIDGSVQRGTVYPILHVQMAPDDYPHYDVVLLEDYRMSFTNKPILHWAAMANVVMFAGGRPISGGGNVPLFDPLHDTSDGHRRMGALDWTRTNEFRGFVRYLIELTSGGAGGGHV